MENHTDCIDAATGEIIGHSRLTSHDELKEMISKAQTAQIEWEKTSVDFRKKKLLKINSFMLNNMDRIAELLSRDNGKTIFDAMSGEVIPAMLALNYYCKNSQKFLKEKKLTHSTLLLSFKRSKVLRIPFGVVGIISPWNYPFAIPFSEIIMALLSGNVVILKTASETQASGLLLKEIMESAELPTNVFNYVNIPGREAGNLFIENGIDKLFFTGSVEVGKEIMKKAGEKLTPLCLELGGNDAMIVCDDADLQRAASGALWAGFHNSGQSCGGVERIYVDEKVYDEFIRILKIKIDNLNVNYGLKLDSEMGCMTTSKQIEVIKKHIEDAVSKGANIYAESKIPIDKSLRNFLPATMLTEVNHNMLVMKEETFGPVVAVMKFRAIEEAIRLANDSNLGLTASVWSKNRKKAERMGRQIKAGAININDHLMSHGLPETPWGGFKQSGIGRTHGQLGFDEMTQPLVIIKDYLPFAKKSLWWQPNSKKLFDGLKGIPELLYGTEIKSRLRGLKNLLKIIPRIFKS